MLHAICKILIKEAINSQNSIFTSSRANSFTTQFVINFILYLIYCFYFRLLNHTMIRLLSVSVHNGTVAVTDALGRAVVLRGNLFNNKENKGREVLHWHFLPAMCCEFSLQGKLKYLPVLHSYFGELTT